jgi:hypothetical protein
LNFWIGALSLGFGLSVGLIGVKSSLLRRKFPPLGKPGVRRIAKPRKFVCCVPSGRSNTTSTQVGLA